MSPLSQQVINLKSVEETLPTPPSPAGSYIPVIQAGNLVYTAGNLPMKDGQVAYTGQVTNETLDAAKSAAKLCVMNCLSAICASLGSLEKIKRIVKVTGFVSSTPHFTDQPTVLNGASDYLVEIFGDAGKHVRSAVGVASLPRNASVEVEMIIEVNS